MYEDEIDTEKKMCTAGQVQGAPQAGSYQSPQYNLHINSIVQNLVSTNYV